MKWLEEDISELQGLLAKTSLLRASTILRMDSCVLAQSYVCVDCFCLSAS